MKSFFYILTGVAVMLLAVWSYDQNHQTRTSLKQVQGVRSEIAELRERAGVLRAEWAYLNRPERLSDLADLNFDRLGLLPLRPEHFSYADDLPLRIDNAQDVMARETSE